VAAWHTTQFVIQRHLMKCAVKPRFLITEYPPGVRPARHRFLTRNRVVAAVAGAAVPKVHNDITVAAAMEAAAMDAAGGSTPIHRSLRRFRSVLVGSRERWSPECRRRAMEDQLQSAIQICRSRTQTESLPPGPNCFGAVVVYPVDDARPLFGANILIHGLSCLAGYLPGPCICHRGTPIVIVPAWICTMFPLAR
jgi:hypothetical protein